MKELLIKITCENDGCMEDFNEICTTCNSQWCKVSIVNIQEEVIE